MNNAVRRAHAILSYIEAQPLAKYIDLEAFGNEAANSLDIVDDEYVNEDERACYEFFTEFMVSHRYLKQSIVDFMNDFAEHQYGSINYVMYFMGELVLSGGKEGANLSIKYDGEMQISDIELVLDVLEDYPFLGVYQIDRDGKEIAIGCNGSCSKFGNVIPTKEGKGIIPPGEE